jgi:hypothetical protein
MAIEKGRKVYTLIKKDNCNVVGTWSNLKYLCESMKDENGFPSYWTLTRMNKENGLLEFEDKSGTAYKIQITLINEIQ